MLGMGIALYDGHTPAPRGGSMSFEEEDRPTGEVPIFAKKPAPVQPVPGKPAAVRLVGRPLGEDGLVRRKVIDHEDMLNLRIALQSTRSVEEFLARV
jgi:hypothetical protein